MNAQRVILVTVLLLAGLVAVVAPPGALAKRSGKHCTLQVLEEREAEAKAPKIRCYKTAAAALAAATGGRVRLAADATPAEAAAALRTQSRGGVGTASADKTVIGLAYDWTEYRADSLFFWTTIPAGCSDGTVYSRPSLTTGWGGWNDRIESVMSFQGCYATVYEHSNQGGAQRTCNDCSTLGLLNNQVSSLRFARP